MEGTTCLYSYSYITKRFFVIVVVVVFLLGGGLVAGAAAGRRRRGLQSVWKSAHIQYDASWCLQLRGQCGGIQVYGMFFMYCEGQLLHLQAEVEIVRRAMGWAVEDIRMCICE